MLKKVIVNFLSVLVISYVIPGVHVSSLGACLAIGTLLTIFNIILTPVLKLLALPVTILTLGLFSFVINAVVLSLAFSLTGSSIDSFMLTIGVSLLIGILNAIFKDKDDDD